MMVLLAQPIGAPDELLVPLTESPNWQQTVLEMIRAAAVPDHQQFSPSLLYGAALSFQALSYAMGSTFGFLRFYIVAVPFTATLALLAVPDGVLLPGRRRGRYAPAVPDPMPTTRLRRLARVAVAFASR
ncbi:hypothetical protein [Mycobacterium sp.]|uniref:hypothetical protein n=1 Tax=Mycobacterium sp. TaxID=1785 RepID=UPI003C78B3DE